MAGNITFLFIIFLFCHR